MVRNSASNTFTGSITNSPGKAIWVDWWTQFRTLSQLERGNQGVSYNFFIFNGLRLQIESTNPPKALYSAQSEAGTHLRSQARRRLVIPNQHHVCLLLVSLGRMDYRLPVLVSSATSARSA